ncbi:hypothetical protein VTK73DRAFT_9310 [Phialemonium thermophilum]|uniref:beta-glucosidase n=1 Tax=Phialemonium thermophilum TaxID=223376 RepID=A0ABR3W3F8_9PEZI
MASTDVDTLLQQLSLEEKIFLLSGADVWQTQEVPRLGIGSIKTTDGPSGARGQFLVDGRPAAFVPSGACQAATWSKSDIQELGRVLCREAKTKASQVLLAPTVCCARNPLAGRNFECFGEDPFLSGTLATEYITGLQESGEVSATIKHFVGNEQEHKRLTIDAVIPEKALREIYLRPFEMAIRSSCPPDCVMTSYNSVNGLHMDMNAPILQEILRREWGFQGLVMSDWGGTNSTVESLLAGLDLEMPGPPDRRGKLLLQVARENSRADIPEVIDSSVRKVLSLLRKHHLLGLSEEEARESRTRVEVSSTSQADIALIRKIAADGIVLLKNEKAILPLGSADLSGRQVAFIGPNALFGPAGGGGAANIEPQYRTHPMDAFRAVARSQGVEVSAQHAPGAYSRKWLPKLSKQHWSLPASSSFAAPGDEKSLLQIDFFAAPDLSGPIAETQRRSNSWIDLADTSPKEFTVDPVPPFSFRITSVLTPRSTGTHSFSLCSVGASRLYVDGALLIENSRFTRLSEAFFTFGSAERVGTMFLTAGRQYTVHVEGWIRTDAEYHEILPDEVNPHFAAYPSVRIGYLEELPSADEMINHAIALADESEYTVVVLGLDDEWESEGYDRQCLSLPGDQNRLVDALVRRCRRPERLIFVHQSGSPCELPWADRVSTLLQAFYGGQEAGHALADVLLGVVNPSGRLPITWPRLYSDLPFASSPASWPDKDGTVHYTEGVQVGYRYYCHNPSKQPQWWFGYGQSYTRFSRTVLKLAAAGESWTLSVEVANIGRYAGREVVQVYGWPETKPEERQLVAFDKTPVLQIGSKTTLEVRVQLRDMARWEDGEWVLLSGNYVLGVGVGVGDASTLTRTIRLEQNRVFSA